MNKYRVTLVQTKTLVIEIREAMEANAISQARSRAITNKLFDKRIGSILIADVQEIKNG